MGRKGIIMEELRIGNHIFYIDEKNYLCLASYFYSDDVTEIITEEKSKEIIEFLTKFVEDHS